jgi:hypothetical protein
MNRLFQRTNSHWAKYSAYAFRTGSDGNLYIMPAENALPTVYDPMKQETLVVEALNVGRLAMKRDKDAELQNAIMQFVSKYGLLGFMSALPTTPEFMNYDAVYLPKNHFIKEEVIGAEDYLSLFFPFEKPDVSKSKNQAQLNVTSESLEKCGSVESYNQERKVVALTGTFVDDPISVPMCLLPIYAERYDWLVTQFQDWAFMLVSAHLYYEDKDKVDEFTRDLYRRGVMAFGNKAPTYHVKLYDDKPTIEWDFYSLLLTIQTMFGFALTDENRPLRICKHCHLAFTSKHNNAAFCSHECKNQHNVNKSRNK